MLRVILLALHSWVAKHAILTVYAMSCLIGWAITIGVR